MKRLLILSLVLCLLLAGCGGQEREEPDRGDREEAQQPTEPKPQGLSELDQAKRYYAYLKEVVLNNESGAVNRQLMPLGPLTVSVNLQSRDMYGFDILTNRYIGLLSAFLEDFDHDGGLEMLCVSVEHRYTYNTAFRDVHFDPGTALDSTTSDNISITLFCTLYDINKKGEIEGVGTEYAHMPTDSWGRLLVGIEKVGEEYYLFGDTVSENMSSYGIRQFLVGNLSKTGTAWRYSSPISYGRADSSNYNELLKINNPITINDTTISGLDIDHPEALGTRLLAMVDFEYPEYGGDEIIITPTDTTELRRHLESNGETWERIALPQGGKIELPESAKLEARSQEIIDKIASATGGTFELTDKKEADGRFTCSYLSDKGNEVALAWSAEGGDLLHASVYSPNENTKDTWLAEWVGAKDVLVGLPELGFTAEQTAPFTGDVKDWVKYTNGAAVGDYTVSLHLVTCAGFSINKN